MTLEAPKTDENPGENACKEMGKCHVPLKPAKWEVVRKKFAEEYKKANDKEVGAAPEPANG